MSQGPNYANVCFLGPNSKKIAIFEIFSKKFLVVKSMILEFHSLKFNENQMKNEPMAAKKLKFQIFALWGSNFKNGYSAVDGFRQMSTWSTLLRLFYKS